MDVWRPTEGIWMKDWNNPCAAFILMTQVTSQADACIIIRIVKYLFIWITKQINRYRHAEVSFVISQVSWDLYAFEVLSYGINA